MKKKTGRKILTVLLTLVMVIGLLPVTSMTALAADNNNATTEAEVRSVFSSGGTVKLGGDITTSSTLTVNSGMTVTLDLNGYTINANNTHGVITVKGTLNIKDSSGGGKITGGYISANSSGAGVRIDGGICNMYGGIITGNKVDYNGGGGGVLVKNGTFNMYGGSITGNSVADNGGGVWVHSGSFNMSGGTITGNNAGKAGKDVMVNNNGNMTMTGGTIGEFSGANYVPITFDANGGSGNMPKQYVKINTATTVKGNGTNSNPAFSRDGYTFDGWNTKSDGTGTNYIAGESTIIISEPITLYAKWTLPPATAPTISAQPQNLNLTYGYAEDSISVTASAEEGHILSYQWYSNTTANNAGGTSIDGATGASYTIPTGKNAGTTEYYYCVVTATRTDNGQTASATSDVATVTVNKADQTVTAPAAVTGLEYTGSAQTLVDAASITEGNTAAGVEYSTDGTNWSASVPQKTDAGSYTVSYRVAGNDNYNAFTGTPVSVTIAIADQTVTAPTAKTGLKYTGAAQALVDAASITKGNTAAGVQYSLDGETYSADIPQGTNAGSYTVNYKVDGNNNYNPFTGTSVTVTIAKATPETPTGLQAKPGQKLSDLTLPDGWAWDAPDTVLEETGEKTFRATFAETANYVGKQVDVTVTISETPVTGVTLDQTALTLKEGKTAELKATVAPADATTKTVKFTSSDENVVTVDASGKVTAKAPGKATVTVTTDDGAKTAACEITVPYEVKTTSGNGGKHKKEKDGDLEFVFEITDHNADTYPAFEKAGKVVTVSDKQLKDSDFKAESGSLKLTLTKKYLDSLKAGSYTVTAKFMLNGLEQTGTATFKVLTSSGGGVETGDNTKANNIVSAMILFLMSLSLIAYTLYSNNLISPKLLAAFAGARTERQSDNIEYSVSEDSFDDLEDIVPEDSADDLEDIVPDDSADSADDGFDDIID